MALKQMLEDVRKIAREPRAAWKYVLSFFKRDWELSDYPLRIREQDRVAFDDESQWRSLRYLARIINWPVMTGTGETTAAAMAALQASFASVKTKRRLPRPGTGLPIEFASQGRITAHSELVDDFIHRVLELPWAWVSDETTLWDFHLGKTNEELCARIMEVYGVDVSDIANANLAMILDRIAASNHGSPRA
jgi:hypothetical protein